MNTHCKYGHPMEGDNLYLSPKGTRGCRMCRNRHAISSHKKNPEKKKQYSRDWMRKQRSENPQRIQQYYLSHEYGITVKEREDMLLSQNNLCAICKRPMDKPCVDHDHVTDQVRGLLCKNCNCALGLFQDDVSVLKSALEYLEVRKCQH